MSDLTPPPMPRGNPHTHGWFFDLLKLFKLDSRPVQAWLDDEDPTGTGKSPQDLLSDLLRLTTDRKKRNQIFEEMDGFGLVQSILDVYAEESTQPDYDKKQKVWIESKAAHMIAAGNDALHNLQVEDRITPIVRRTCKYGDAFQRLIYATGRGVLGWKTAKSAEMARLEDKYGRLIGFRQQGMKFRDKGRDTSWPWDYTHFRLLGRDEEDLYGTSLLEAMFRPWRQMMLSEDGMLMFRMRRMPDRNMIFVDTGSLEAHESLEYVNTWRKRFRKYEYVDPASPSYKHQYNPLTPFEDIFVPFREGTNTRVETLSGAGNVGEIYDIEFFRDSFFGTAKVPKAYFGFEGDINAKATLAQQDVRFARTLKRVQHAAVVGLRSTLDTHFTLLNDKSGKFDFLNAQNYYTVQMSPISFLDEFERLELIQLRYQIVQSLVGFAGDMQIDARVWAIYILLNYAKLPEDLVLKLIKKVPDQVQGGGGLDAAGGVDLNLDADQQEQVRDREGKQALGAYSLTEEEQLKCAKMIHNSPGLRKSIAVWAEYASDCSMDSMVRQIDTSSLPPRIGGKVFIESTFSANDSDAKELHEDLAALEAKRLEEVEKEEDAEKQLNEEATP